MSGQASADAAPALNEKSLHPSSSSDSRVEAESTVAPSAAHSDDHDHEKTTTKHGTGHGLTITEDEADFGDKEEKLAKRDTDAALPPARDDGKVELTEEAGYSHTAFAWTTSKKWYVLTVIALVQLSMNFNTSVWPNAIDEVSEKFHVSAQAARTTQMIFLVCYAFGCEVWAPFSEEFGRRPILQLSLFLVNIWQFLGVFAPNFGSLLVARGLGGLSTAGGSVTLGMVADLYDIDAQQYAVAYVVLSSVGGTSIGPVIGGFIQQYSTYRWIFWVQLIFGGAVQILHFFTVPETRSTILLDREAKRRRKAGDENIWGPNELKENRLSPKELGRYIARPFVMFVQEPIVLSMSLLSGFSDALIFTFLEAYNPVYKQWGFSASQIGLAYIPINLGYLLAFLIFIPVIAKQRKIRSKLGSKALQPEARLWLLLYLAPLEPIGLFGFAWTSLGPPHVHWIAPMIFSVLIAIANYAIYMATIDYMIAAYGPYSASATGGNGMARDFLAGISAMYATPLYSNLGSMSLEWASTLLGCLAVLLIIPVVLAYAYGPQIRARSKFAQSLADDRDSKESKRQEKGEQ
ncbi:unnamed protein product [Parajaminaea phylloscopi]